MNKAVYIIEMVSGHYPMTGAIVETVVIDTIEELEAVILKLEPHITYDRYMQLTKMELGSEGNILERKTVHRTEEGLTWKNKGIESMINQDN